MQLYVATTNQGKVRDFAAAAGGRVQLAPLPEIAGAPAPEENEATFEANARKKAEYYSHIAPGRLVLADDSGIEVEALGGAPGVHSARYAAIEIGQNASDADNNILLLRNLELVPDERRRARFVCVLTLARDGRTLLTASGEVEGFILRVPRGVNGFGYDPLFYLPDLGKTTAELTPAQKAQVSHRGRAFRKLLEQIEQLKD